MWTHQVPLLTKENALETKLSVRKTTRKREVWVELGKQAQYDFVHNELYTPRHMQAALLNWTRLLPYFSEKRKWIVKSAPRSITWRQVVRRPPSFWFSKLHKMLSLLRGDLGSLPQIHRKVQFLQRELFLQSRVSRSKWSLTLDS